jgi:hypothetical protein
MWHWLNREGNWVTRQLGRMRRLVGRPRLHSVEFGYEKAGVTVRNEAIPWNADTVLVEAALKGPPGAAWPREQFYLKAVGGPVLTATALDPLGPDGCVHVHFRLAPQRKPTCVVLYWRSLALGHLFLPHLSAEEFLQNLEVEAATLFARLGDQQVACQAVVEGQCDGLLAGALLKSPTALLPVHDWPVTLELTDPCGDYTQQVPVRLSRSQLTGRQALVSAAWPFGLERAGLWEVRWRVADRLLARSEICTIPPDVFRKSLFWADGPPCLDQSDGAIASSLEQSDGRLDGSPIPCFRVASRVAGLAGYCSLELCARLQSGARVAGFRKKQMVVTDVPSSFPTPFTPLDFLLISGLELFGDGQFLGLVSRYPKPVIHFTSEGGFRGSEDFPWTAFAEVELEQRLGNLLEVPSS